jgi:hypothetical protein
MDSNPTPRAIIVDSYDDFISSTNDNGIDKDLQESLSIELCNLQNIRIDKLKNSIDSICNIKNPLLENLWIVS